MSNVNSLVQSLCHENPSDIIAAARMLLRRQSKIDRLKKDLAKAIEEYVGPSAANKSSGSGSKLAQFIRLVRKNPGYLGDFYLKTLGLSANTHEWQRIREQSCMQGAIEQRGQNRGIRYYPVGHQ